MTITSPAALLHEATITVPGACHGMPVIPGPDDREQIITDSAGQHHDGDLLLGETRLHQQVWLEHWTSPQLHALAIAAERLAGWKETP